LRFIGRIEVQATGGEGLPVGVLDEGVLRIGIGGVPLGTRRLAPWRAEHLPSQPIEVRELFVRLWTSHFHVANS
jgi:hypothetical protein